MKWTPLTDEQQLLQIDSESRRHPVMIFKHSTRCSISQTALNRLERQWTEERIKPYYLDLLSYRSVSNKIAEHYNIEHESPQALLIENGKAVRVLSHFEINAEAIASPVKN